MSKKVYRSAQGKTVDLGAIQLQNENIRAVGNMGVNARGDKINPQGKTVDSRNKSVGKHYKKQTRNNVSDDVVYDSKQAIKQQQKPIEEKPVEVVKQPEPVVEDPVVEPAPPPMGGLAGAIAKAKTVKQEPMKTPRQLAQEKAGVNKI